MQSSNNTDIRILALAGSFRRGSLNQALIQTARELAPEHVRIEDFDLRTVPFYDGAFEAAGDPEEVKTLKSAIADSDVLSIATPEYNGSIPAVLKNTLDWASRRRPDSPLRDKPVAVMSATPSRGGTRRTQAHLREVLSGIRANVVSEPSLYLARATEHVSDGRLTSEDAREAVRKIVATLADAKPAGVAA